jgi:hypothetical protein
VLGAVLRQVDTNLLHHQIALRHDLERTAHHARRDFGAVEQDRALQVPEPRPHSTLSSVVLPAPEGHMSATRRAGGNERLMSLRIGTLPRALAGEHGK